MKGNMPSVSHQSWQKRHQYRLYYVPPSVEGGSRPLSTLLDSPHRFLLCDSGHRMLKYYPEPYSILAMGAVQPELGLNYPKMGSILSPPPLLFLNFIHMCIQCLGHFSTFPRPISYPSNPHLPPQHLATRRKLFCPYL
jgi:hypothetical protein